MNYANHAFQHIEMRMPYITHQSKILDVGTGTGAAAFTAIQRGYKHVVAVDYAPDMITTLQQKRDKVRVQWCDMHVIYLSYV